jgi:hypothetical protein
MNTKKLCDILNNMKEEEGDAIISLLRKRIDVSEFGNKFTSLGVRSDGTVSLLGFLNGCMISSNSGEIISIVVDDKDDKFIEFKVLNTGDNANG